jgi:hypothetical protein
MSYLRAKAGMACASVPHSDTQTKAVAVAIRTVFVIGNVRRDAPVRLAIDPGCKLIALLLQAVGSLYQRKDLQGGWFIPPFPGLGGEEGHFWLMQLILLMF